ncbi:hypothetical protein Bca101_101486 [Brassica carinata]
MIGRADIEGSKSSVAMSGLAATSQLSLCFKFRRSKGSIGHAFTVRIRTENQNQTSFYPFVPHEISVLVELILGHLRYLLTDVPPQPNSPPDNVLRRIDPRASLGSKEGVVTPPPIHGVILSWLFGAGKARKSRSQSVPGRHEAVARHVSGSSSPPTVGGLNWDPEPSPRANPFPSYGSILPTSLAYIVPSTRGCSPWRPDAVMSATGRGGFRSSGFSRARECTDTTRRAASDLRQYRCGPPPEFPLAARSGIVHHLSGPDSMLTLEPFSEDQGRSAVHREDPANQLPYALRVYSPVDSHTCQTPWSVFQGGSNGSPQAGALSTQMRGAPWRVLQTTIKAAASRGPLGGIYRPIGAAFPNNPTRRQRLRGATGSNARALTLSGAPFQGTWARSVAEALLRTTIRAPKASDFQAGLFGSLAVTKGILRVIRLTWGRVEDFGSSRAFGRSIGDLARIEFTTACQGAPGILSSDFGQPSALKHGRPASVRYPREDWGTTICDTQADVPSARRLGAQLAFKDSMVHGILQFTPRIAFRSFFIDHERDIRCRESF